MSGSTSVERVRRALARPLIHPIQRLISNTRSVRETSRARGASALLVLAEAACVQRQRAVGPSRRSRARSAITRAVRRVARGTPRRAPPRPPGSQLRDERSRAVVAHPRHDVLERLPHAFQIGLHRSASLRLLGVERPRISPRSARSRDRARRRDPRCGSPLRAPADAASSAPRSADSSRRAA